MSDFSITDANLRQVRTQEALTNLVRWGKLKLGDRIMFPIGDSAYPTLRRKISGIVRDSSGEVCQVILDPHQFS